MPRARAMHKSLSHPSAMRKQRVRICPVSQIATTPPPVFRLTVTNATGAGIAPDLCVAFPGELACRRGVVLTQSLFRALGREWDVNGVKDTRREVCMGVPGRPGWHRDEFWTVVVSGDSGQCRQGRRQLNRRSASLDSKSGSCLPNLSIRSTSPSSFNPG